MRKWMPPVLAFLVALLMTAWFSAASAFTLPGGVNVPGNLSTPQIPGDLQAALGPLLQQFEATGTLPAETSPNDIAGLFQIPPDSLPPDLSQVVSALRQLAAGEVDSSVAAQVWCVINAFTSGQTTPFTDLSSVPWAQGPIAALQAAGVVSGTGGGKFDPDGNLTQEQWLTMLMRGLGLANTGAPGQNQLTGVDPWAAPAVEQALQKGLLPPDGGIALDPRVQSTAIRP